METIKSYILDKEVSEKLEAIDSFGICKNSDNIIYKIIGYEDCIFDSECTLGKNLFYDLEFFKDYTNTDNDESILSSINFTNLKGGKHYLENLLSKPIHCIKTLEKRQKLLSDIKEKIKAEELKFKKLKELEDDMLWLYDIKNDDNGFDILYDMVYLNNWVISRLNNNEHILNAYNLYRIVGSPAIGILSPISYFIIPYLILVFKMKINISFTSYMKLILQTLFSGPSMGVIGKLKYVSMLFSIIFYFQGLFNSVEISKATYKISQTITNKINNIVEYIQISKDLNDKLWSDDINTFVNDVTIQDLKKTNYFDKYNLKKFGILSGFGRQLKIYKFIKSETYIPLFKRVYILDMLLSICLLEGFTPSKYITSETSPSIIVKSMWHPCIDTSKRVSNDLSIIENRNVILTGPNAGGKSTTIKTLLIVVLFAQTLSISPVDNLELTPFYYISSQINIPDCKGRESLFEAEMYRSKDNIEFVSNLEKNQFSILAMDEIFNSTNPIEGISGAYAICKKLSSYSNNISIISTHYLYLTKLAKDFPDKFSTYKMNVVMNSNDVVIKYPYKITKGISRQYIAIELLKENGFDDDIIKDALLIKSKFVSSKK